MEAAVDGDEVDRGSTLEDGKSIYALCISVLLGRSLETAYIPARRQLLLPFARILRWTILVHMTSEGVLLRRSHKRRVLQLLRVVASRSGGVSSALLRPDLVQWPFRQPQTADEGLCDLLQCHCGGGDGKAKCVVGNGWSLGLG